MDYQRSIAIGVICGAFALIVGLWQRRRNRKFGLPDVVPMTPCPKCGREPPAVRLPTSITQFISGGWNCPGCGCEIDFSGNPIEKNNG